jgi:excisionase family DNA binding protein
MDRLLDRTETADRLHVSVMTVRRLGAAGDIEEIRVGTRSIRISEESVERYLTGRRVTRDSPSRAHDREGKERWPLPEVRTSQ